jgi:hypothetical protein
MFALGLSPKVTLDKQGLVKFINFIKPLANFETIGQTFGLQGSEKRLDFVVFDVRPKKDIPRRQRRH